MYNITTVNNNKNNKCICVEWYESGNKKAEYNLIDGKFHGEITLWHDKKNQIKESTTYIHDKRHGKSTFFSESGNIIKVIDYVNERIQGKIIKYYDCENKIIETECEYANNKQYGKYRSYYKSGKKRCEGTYIDEKKYGIWTSWHENGKIKKQGSYSRYTYGKKAGSWKFYDEHGKMYDEKIYGE
jgi:antitoxin component YwqK of YwqJK toxin-antitoxin module